MAQHGHGGRSHLFTLRVWPEDRDDGGVEWRGKVQHVISGEQQYFRDWSTLIAFLTATGVPGDELPAAGRMKDEG